MSRKSSVEPVSKKQKSAKQPQDKRRGRKSRNMNDNSVNNLIRIMSPLSHMFTVADPNATYGAFFTAANPTSGDIARMTG